MRGLELAQTMRRFGSCVSVIEQGPQLAGNEVRVLTEGPDGEGAIEGSDLLIAVGRTPNTAGIGLERAGVDRTTASFIPIRPLRVRR